MSSIYSVKIEKNNCGLDAVFDDYLWLLIIIDYHVELV